MRLKNSFTKWVSFCSLMLVVLLILGACAQPAPMPAPAPAPAAPKAPAAPAEPAEPEAPKPAAPASAPTAPPVKKVAPVIGVEIDTSHPMADDLGPLKIEMPNFFTYSGTSAPGSPYTFLVNPMIVNIEKAFSGTTVRHLPGGTTTNQNRVSSGEAELGINNMCEMAMAHVPYKPMYPEITNTRLLAILPIDYGLVLISLKGSGIDSVDDLAGKRLGTLAPQASVTRFCLPSLLSLYGLSYESIEAAGGSVYYSSGAWVEDQFDKLLSGELDAITLGINHPHATIHSKELVKDLTFFGDVTEAQLAEIQKILPGLGMFVMPKGMYKDLDKDFPALSYVFAFMANKDLPDEVVYNLMWAVFKDSGKALNEAHPGQARWDYINAQTNPGLQVCMWHPGALKYWEARGLDRPPRMPPPADWVK